MGESSIEATGGEPVRPSIPLFWSLVPVVALVVMLVANVRIMEDATSGANQMVLLMAAAVAAIVGACFGVPFTAVIDGIVRSVSATTPAILVLLSIGALSGAWMVSGVVPAMIFYGLNIMSPMWFLMATVIVCSIVSLATGSSWSTIATVGIALVGIGQSLGISPAMSAGAIISGAYFGDKMSPLSDTTNLAAAMAQTNLFVHIRHMMWTTVPSLIITLLVFGILGITGARDIATGNAEFATGQQLSQAIENTFDLSPALLLVPAAVLLMVVLKFDVLVAMVGGTALGIVVAIVFQPEVMAKLVPEDLGWPARMWQASLTAMGQATAIDSGNPNVDKLLSSGGMAGMLNTVWLILCAMCFGGAMEACGMLDSISRPLVRAAKSQGALTGSTAAACLFVNVTASDQYIAIVVPGRMFRRAFSDRGIESKYLSRTLEDAGTVTSVLIPWNTCGAAQATVLGVATFAYAPWCVFNLVCPLITIAFGYVAGSGSNEKASGSVQVG